MLYIIRDDNVIADVCIISNGIGSWEAFLVIIFVLLSSPIGIINDDLESCCYLVFNYGVFATTLATTKVVANSQ
jgi:hypothetical protein